MEKYIKVYLTIWTIHRDIIKHKFDWVIKHNGQLDIEKHIYCLLDQQRYMDHLGTIISITLLNYQQNTLNHMLNDKLFKINIIHNRIGLDTYMNYY